MGHGNGIKWYRRITLPGYGIAAADACLAVEPARPPGTPDEFYAAATRLAQRAQALRDVLNKLRAIDATEGVWVGDAADAFRSVLRDAHSSHYDQVPVRYDGYARALRQYATTLSGHQSAIDSTRADVQAAVDAYHRAQSVAPPPFPSPVHLPSPGAAAVVDDCLAAARRFQTAYNDWIDAVTACEHAIEHVDDDKLHNPHGAHVAVDLVAHWSGVLANLTGALAVLTIYWPPVALTFLELSSAFSLVQFGADITRRAAWHENVTPTDFAIDALGSLPLLAPVKEGAAGVRASTSVRSLGKLRVGFTVAGRTLRNEIKAMIPTAEDLRQAGLLGTLRHPRLGKDVIKMWDVQDATALGAQVGRQAVNGRQQGVARATEKAAFSVVLGPLGIPALTALDKLAVATGGRRAAAGH